LGLSWFKIELIDLLEPISKIRLGFNKKQVERCEIPKIGARNG